MNKDVMEKYLPKSKRVRMLVLMAIDVCAAWHLFLDFLSGLT